MYIVTTSIFIADSICTTQINNLAIKLIASPSQFFLLELRYHFQNLSYKCI